MDWNSSIIQQYMGWQWQLYKLSLPCDQSRSRRNKAIDATTRNHEAFFLHGATAPRGSQPPPYRGSKITPWHTTLGWNPLDELPARRRDLYLTTHNTHKRQTSMPPAGFEPVIPASLRPHGHLDRLTTHYCYPYKFLPSKFDIRTRYCHDFKLR